MELLQPEVTKCQNNLRATSEKLMKTMEERVSYFYIYIWRLVSAMFCHILDSINVYFNPTDDRKRRGIIDEYDIVKRRYNRRNQRST